MNNIKCYTIGLYILAGALSCVHAFGATLEYYDYLRDYYYNGDDTYLYGGKRTLKGVTASATQIVRRTGNGDESYGFDFASLFSTYRIEDIYTTSISGTIFVQIKDKTDKSYFYLYKSIDGGMSFGDNSPYYNNGNYVMRIGWNGSTHIPAVMLFGRGAFCEAYVNGKKVFIVGEYNINGSRIPGSTNDQVRVMRSDDMGDTWTEVIHWNTEYGKTNLRHVHTVRTDPFSGDVYIGVGDDDDESGIIRWNVSKDILALSNHPPAWYAANATYEKDGISVGVTYGSQRTRPGPFAFDEKYIYWSADTTVLSGMRGIWRAPKDLSTKTRVDKSIEDFPGYNGFYLMRTSTGLFIAGNWITENAKDKNLPLQISADGEIWRTIGSITMQIDAKNTYISMFEWKNHLYLPSTYYQVGHWRYGGTVVLTESNSNTGDASTILTPDALNFYIDPSVGNDDYRGNSDKEPWKTTTPIKSNFSSISPGSHIMFRSGQDVLSSDSSGGIISVQNSGLEGKPIVFGSYGGGRATISGATRLSYTWEGNIPSWDPHIYIALRSSPDSLYYIWKGAKKDSVMTRVFTHSALDGNLKWRTTPDSLVVYVNSPDDLTWLWGTKNPVIRTNAFSHIVFQDLNFEYGADNISGGNRLVSISGVSNDIKFERCRFAGGTYVQVFPESGSISTISFNDCMFMHTITSWAIYTRGIGNSIENCTFFSPYALRCLSDNGTIFKHNKCLGTSTHITLSGTVTYEGDYNTFNSSGNWSINSSKKTTLAAWQSATNQETHSITTDAIMVETTHPYTVSITSITPNPFNASTTISFTMPKAGRASLSIYSAAGQKVTELADGYFTVGNNTIRWNAGNQASGMYFVRLESGGAISYKKMMLVR